MRRRAPRGYHANGLAHAGNFALARGVKNGNAMANPVYTRSLRWLRGALTAVTALMFLAMALVDERPLVMLAGFAPLALLAAEAVWHALAGLERRKSSAERAQLQSATP